MCGDFNMVENIPLDRLGGHPTSRATWGLQALNEFKTTVALTDVWRELHPHKKQFTRHNSLENVHSRIDRIYIPTLWIPLVSSAYISHFVWSDHDMCVVQFSLPNTIKLGRGYWKLNIQYLEHAQYRELISEFWQHWQQRKPEYANVQI